jgi:hypothetical protein
MIVVAFCLVIRDSQTLFGDVTLNTIGYNNDCCGASSASSSSFKNMSNLIHNVGAFSAAVLPAVSANAVVESVNALPLVAPIHLWSTNPLVMGAAWMLSSAIFTTYSTTKFIKYPPSTLAPPVHETRKSRPLPTLERSHQRHWMPLHPSRQKILLRPPFLSPSSRLTLYRFAGSLFLGLLFPLAGSMRQRWSETVRAIPPFLLPAVCLFVANFANAYVEVRTGMESAGM